MTVCPLCNKFQEREVECHHCGHLMDDRGKMTDYFDDYSAYVDTDGIKQVDGIAHDLRMNQCPHIFYCSACTSNKIILIPEMDT